MRRTLTINGAQYVALPLRDRDVRPGVMLAGVYNRTAYRIVCIDGGDAVLRNMRHPQILSADPVETLKEHYVRVESCSQES